MTVRILTGDVRDMLATLPDESVHCVVTSPPYWSLRDYGVEGQIGMEPTMGEHIETMVAVFREVRRVLRKDGTVWLNYGDCYASGGNGGHAASSVFHGHRPRPGDRTGDRKTPTDGLKPKDLCMMSNRLAIALQDDGWWIRSEIIWHKPNPMPESATDRPATAHEKVWLLTRSARYFYDVEAVRRPLISTPEQYARSGASVRQNHQFGEVSGRKLGAKSFLNVPDGANLRNVWTISTKGFSGAHYATFPPDLVVPCIKAGTSEKGCCAECGAPWARDVSENAEYKEWKAKQLFYGEGGKGSAFRAKGTNFPTTPVKNTTIGWSPSCACDAATIPCTVLDPFIGSGTTAMVADRLGRDCIGIDLNPANVGMATERVTQDAGMFAEVS